MSDATTSCNIGGQTSTIPQNRIIERKMPVSKRSSRRKRHTGTVECVKKPGLRGMKMKIWRQKRSVKLPLFWVNHKFASPQVPKSPSSQVLRNCYVNGRIMRVYRHTFTRKGRLVSTGVFYADVYVFGRRTPSDPTGSIPRRLNVNPEAF